MPYLKKTKCARCEKEVQCMWLPDAKEWVCHPCLYPPADKLADLVKAAQKLEAICGE